MDKISLIGCVIVSVIALFVLSDCRQIRPRNGPTGMPPHTRYMEMCMKQEDMEAYCKDCKIDLCGKHSGTDFLHFQQVNVEGYLKVRDQLQVFICHWLQDKAAGSCVPPQYQPQYKKQYITHTCGNIEAKCLMYIGIYQYCHVCQDIYCPLYENRDFSQHAEDVLVATLKNHSANWALDRDCKHNIRQYCYTCTDFYCRLYDRRDFSQYKEEDLVAALRRYSSYWMDGKGCRIQGILEW